MVNDYKIFDCFTFFNEKELLELRLMEYYDYVDYFVIVEATKTHTGKPHQPILNSLKPQLEKYWDKIIHIIVKDLPDYSSDNIWTAENFQRNAIERGLNGIAKKGDAIFVSDCDEFWNVDKLNECIGCEYPKVFEQDLFYYWVNCKQNCKWNGTCYAPYGFMTPQEMRNYARFNEKPNIIQNGGWHYSYMGGAERIKEKVDNIAESEIIIEKVGDIDKIQNSMNKVNDLWDRTDDYAKKKLILLNEYKPQKLDKFLNKYPNFINNKKNIEIISLIYCSTEYLDLIAKELKKIEDENPDLIVGTRIIANDANKKVLKKLKALNINYTIYNDKNPKDYYINRVYRCYNYAVKTSQYNNVCLINSDMVFAKNWLKNLLKYHDGINIPTSRLVESGKMPSGKYGIGINCGKTATNIDFEKWHKISEKLQNEDKDTVKDGGLFMPVIFEKSRFLEAGGYPEGNIYKDNTIGTCNGNVIKSGDDYFFSEILTKKYNMKHITVFDSLCYHIQEGEKDSDWKTNTKTALKKLLYKEKIGNKRILHLLGLKISYKKKPSEKFNGIKGLPDNIKTWKHNPVINEDAYKIIKNIKNIKTVVDFGAGDGFWGKLCKYINSAYNITGVELESSYIEKNNLSQIYDRVINDSIVNVADKLSADLLICGDVLEHLPENECRNVIDKIKTRYKYILINGPIGFQEQTSDISSEIHRCGLHKDFFKTLKIKKYKSYENNTMFLLFAEGGDN